MVLKEYLGKFINHRMHFGISGLTPREKLEKVRSTKPETEDEEVERKNREPLPKGCFWYKGTELNSEVKEHFKIQRPHDFS